MYTFIYTLINISHGTQNITHYYRQQVYDTTFTHKYVFPNNNYYYLQNHYKYLKLLVILVHIYKVG